VAADQALHRSLKPAYTPAMAKIAFEIAPTPNPHARRVGLGDALFERPSTFLKAADAAGQPLVAALLKLPGVQQVFALGNFMTVTKTTSADWASLEPAMAHVLKEHLDG
jgi:hypothetical protein